MHSPAGRASHHHRSAAKFCFRNPHRQRPARALPQGGRPSSGPRCTPEACPPRSVHRSAARPRQLLAAASRSESAACPASLHCDAAWACALRTPFAAYSVGARCLSAAQATADLHAAGRCHGLACHCSPSMALAAAEGCQPPGSARTLHVQGAAEAGPTRLRQGSISAFLPGHKETAWHGHRDPAAPTPSRQHT